MIKRILVTIVAIFSFSTVFLYSQNGFELTIYGLGGVNFSFPNFYNAEFLRKTSLTNFPVKGVDSFYDTGVGFGFSGDLQLGYYMDFYKEVSGLSILFDASISYTRASFAATFQNDPKENTNRYNDIVTYQSDTFTMNAGFLVKMYLFKNFAFGIGGGVKLSFFDENILLKLDPPGTNRTKETTYTSPPVSMISPYGKVTVEYCIFFTGNFSMRIGIYGDLDIGQLLLGENAKGKTMLVNVGGSLGFGHIFRFD